MDKTKTYIGYTNNPDKRLRQHNGEISGGAKSTRGNKWEIMCLISGFENINSAMSLEYKLKHPNGTRRNISKYSGIQGKINTLNKVLPELTDNYKVCILEEYHDKLNLIKIPANIDISIYKKIIN